MRHKLLPLAVLGGIVGWAGCFTEFPTDILPPCDRSDPDPLCGTGCTDDGDCGSDLYCGPGDLCTADCSGAEHCGAGQACEHGRCVDVEQPDAAVEPDADVPQDADVQQDGGGCTGETVVPVSPILPVAVFTVSQGASMDTGLQGGTRFTAVQAALADPADGVVTQNEQDFLFGATLFTSHGGSAGGTCPELASVVPALGTSADIHTLMTDNPPAQDSPAADAIDQVAADLDALPALPDNLDPPRSIVLIMDELPDTCADPDPQTGHPAALTAVEDAYLAGIETYVVSLVDGYDAPLAQELANAGVGLAPGGPTDAPYWVPNNAGQLDAAVAEIVAGLRTCRMHLGASVDASRAPEASVSLNTMALSYGTGYELPDPTTLVLVGAACDLYRENPGFAVSVRFPCDAVTP